MIRRDSLGYWCGKPLLPTQPGRRYQGPTHGALIFPDGSYLIVCFSDPAAGTMIAKSHGRAVAWALGHGDEKTGTWTGHANKGDRASLAYPPRYNTTAPLAVVVPAILSIYEEAVRELDAVASDPNLSLEVVLSSYDWVASEGEDSYSRVVLPALRGVSTDIARSLWNQYAPSDLSCPV